MGEPDNSTIKPGSTALNPIFQVSNRRIAIIALFVIALDQLTKKLVLHFFSVGQEKVIIDGFFRLVYWGNTGAAWSIFRGRNALLAGVAIIALFILYFSRRHFDAHTVPGQIAFGLIFGGIIGNLMDRLLVKHVVDFLYFYLEQRGGTEIGFPAFNVADSAICTGVGLILLLTWRNEQHQREDTSDPGAVETPK